MSFFGDSFNEKKLKANLKLAINRLKLVEKKKTEIALRERKEISDYIRVNKIERARIRVEHIIREDYLVEALEIIEMQCDLLLARCALLGGKEKNKVPHVSIHEAIDSVIWAYPQISGDCLELKVVVQQLSILFGKQYIAEVQNKAGEENPHVNKKLVSRLDPVAPKAYIIETYLQAISEAYDVEYTPDQAVMAAYARQNAIREEDLINVGDQNVDTFMPTIPQGLPGGNNNYPKNGGGGGGMATTLPPAQPPQAAFQYPTPSVRQPTNEFDQVPNIFGQNQTPNNFVAPSAVAPIPPANNQQPSSTAPQHNIIYDDGQDLSSGVDTYQAPSVKNQQRTNAKSKEAEQQYTGGQSRGVEQPPSYTVVHDTDSSLTGYAFNNQQQQQQQQPKAAADDDFDIDALMPTIPTGFKKNDNDDNNQGGGSGGDFDDLEARFANLKK